MRIGELSRRTGVTVRMLRYYEQQGLIASERTGTGQRTYPPTTPDRVGLLRALFAPGLSSRRIAQVLPCVSAPSVATSEQAYEVMTGERERIDREIAELGRARTLLDEMITGNRDHRARPGPAAHAS